MINKLTQEQYDRLINGGHGIYSALKDISYKKLAPLFSEYDNSYELFHEVTKLTKKATDEMTKLTNIILSMKPGDEND